MKNKLLSILLAFIRKSFCKERLLNFISDLLDILYDRFAGPAGCVDERVEDQASNFRDMKEVLSDEPL